MTLLRGAGLKAMQDLARRWQMDPARSRWRDDGFDWWPGDYLISIRIAHKPDVRPGLRWRATVSTHLVGEFPEGYAGQILTHGYATLHGTTHGWIVPPPEALRDSGGNPRLTFHSSVYFDDNEFLETWSKLLAGAGLFQALSAQDHGPMVARSSGSVPRHYPEDGEAAGGDAAVVDFMASAADLFVPPMEAPNAWAGRGELAELTTLFSSTDKYFVVGDDTRISAEVAFGDNTALLQVLTDIVSPSIGAGLGLRLRLPVWLPRREAIQLAARMNWEEVSSWTGLPIMGNWVASDLGDDGPMGVDYRIFVPNALSWEGVAGNLAASMLERADWVHQTFWPEVEDRPLIDILNDRFGY
jgi:hypothetical protein